MPDNARFDKRRILSLIFLSGCFILALQDLCYALPSVEVHNQRITLKTQDVPLGDIIRDIAQQAAISLVIQGRLDDPVTLELRDVPMEDALKKLLSRYSFSLIYGRTSSGANAKEQIRKVFVFSGKGAIRTVPFDRKPDPPAIPVRSEPKTALESPARDNPANTFVSRAPDETADEEKPRVGQGVSVKAKREMIEGIGKDTLSSQIAARAVPLRLGLAGGPDLRKEGAGLPEMKGVQITNVSKGSVLEKMGIRPGDVIQDINGTQTATPDQMAEALHRAFADPDVPVRIEVERGDVIEPIYVEMK